MPSIGRFRSRHEILAEVRPAREKRPGGEAALQLVTALTAGDEVALGIIAASHLRLHVIQREILLEKGFGAVNAAESIPPQDSHATSRHRTIQSHVIYYTGHTLRVRFPLPC